MKRIIALILCLTVLCISICTAESTWTCPTCGREGNTKNFCPSCGTAKPAEDEHDDLWDCPACGFKGNPGNYCQQCSSPKPEEAIESEEEAESASTAEVSVGDIITFWHYEQDNDLINGAEPIEWIVIEVNDDGSLVLMSKYGLDCKQYNSNPTDVTWETCTLRAWLNDEFYNAAFSTDEQTQIIAVHNLNEHEKDVNETIDKVWLLSMDEVGFGYSDVIEPYTYFTNYESKMCAPTRYAIVHGAQQSSGSDSVDGIATCRWWLRSIFYSIKSCTYASYDGITGFYNGYGGYATLAVRPVVCVIPS